MKRLFALLLLCFMLFMTGCTEQGTEIPLPDPIPGLDTPIQESDESQAEDPIAILKEDETLFQNLQFVCEQIGIDTEDIVAVERMEDGEKGPMYAFGYNEYAWMLCCNTDKTIDELYLGSSLLVFSKSEGAYPIENFMPEEQILIQTEGLTQMLLKEQLGIDEDKSLPLLGWYSERDCNLYHLFGTVRDASDGDRDISFSLQFEHDAEAELLHLRHFNFDGYEIMVWQKILCKRLSTKSRMALWKRGGIRRTSPWRLSSRERAAVCAPQA